MMRFTILAALALLSACSPPQSKGERIAGVMFTLFVDGKPTNLSCVVMAPHKECSAKFRERTVHGDFTNLKVEARWEAIAVSHK
jgi:hypothetical protein